MKHRYVILFFAVMFGICFFLFNSFYHQAKLEAIKSKNNEQLLAARQAARGIEDIFNSWRRILIAMSDSGHVINMDDVGKQEVDLLYSANKDWIRAITRVDAEGKIAYSFPYNRNTIGRDISQQDHIREIMRTHQPVVSNVFSTVQGYDAVAIHVPVFGGGTYQGSIGIVVNFHALAKRYLEDIKIGNTGYAWVVSRDGTELYCPVPGHTGNSVFKNCKDFPSILVMARDMLKGRQDLATYTYNMIRGNRSETVRKYAVYMPINLGNTFWSIVVASSEDEITASLKGFRNKLLAVMAFLILGGILFAYYGLKAWFVIGEEKKRRTIEASLKASEEKYREIFEGATEGIFQTTPDGRYLSMNPAFARMFGFASPQEMIDHVTNIGRQLYVNPKDRDEMVRLLREHNKVEGYEIEVYHRDGSRFWISMNIHTVRNASGDILYFEGTDVDITERKRVEKLLRASEERFRSLVETTSDWLWETDAQGVYTYASPKVKDILGYEPSEIVGKRPPDLMVPAEAERIKGIIFPYFEERKPFTAFENLNLHKDGRLVVLETSGVPILDENGQLSGYRGVDRDITGRKRAEEEKRNLEARLNRAEKMEALGTLAGGVAHDLNNVLGIIVGFAELLLKSGAATDQIKAPLENIMKGGQKAAAIVDDLLTLARRGVGSSRQVLNLNHVITDMQQSPELEKLRSFHPAVRIRTDLEPALLNMSGSSVHLHKTLYNLMSNACEAMPAGGDLTIRTANQYLDNPIQGYDEVRAGEYVVLSVSDTGGGITAVDLKRIFEPFYTKKVMGRSGTGLGLAVVWGTVKDHHGYINVQSEEGRGSTFTLYFPVVRQDIDVPVTAIAMSEYMGRGESVLVVDDVKEQRELAVSMLTMLNYNVSSVPGGEDAIAYLKEHAVDLMILDMIMEPGMDGLDTYRSVLKINPEQKAIIVSGFSESDRVRDAQALGAGAYVKKPYVIEKLGLVVREALAKTQQ